jgi:5-methylcytosine-specific restriction endonuclease McrA
MKKFTNSGQFKKGVKPWITGKKGYIKNPLKGKKMPEEWRKKLMKPKSVVQPFTKERRKKISKALKGKYVGVNSSNWKGGTATLEHSQIRRERNRQAVGSHTGGEWELLKIQYGFSCPCCHQAEPTIKLTKDHIIPLSRGGSNFIENIQPLCQRCNVKKFTKTIKY